MLGHSQRHCPCLHGHSQVSGLSVFQFPQGEKEPLSGKSNWSLSWRKYVSWKRNLFFPDLLGPVLVTWPHLSARKTEKCSLYINYHISRKKETICIQPWFAPLSAKYLTHHSTHTCNTRPFSYNTRSPIWLLWPDQNSVSLSDGQLFHLVQSGSSCPERYKRESSLCMLSTSFPICTQSTVGTKF